MLRTAASRLASRTAVQAVRSVYSDAECGKHVCKGAVAAKYLEKQGKLWFLGSHSRFVLCAVWSQECSLDTAASREWSSVFGSCVLFKPLQVWLLGPLTDQPGPLTWLLLTKLPQP